MKDCAKDVLAYHDDKVTLPQSERTNMRDRRNANRDRLKTRLKAKDKPLPQEFIKQGSYAMMTMVQDANNDYDIDDGVYFTQASLKGSNGGNMSARDARQMVCDALADERFNNQPVVKKNCVRIFYNDGYHVDMPVYRIRDDSGDYELASSDWVHSRAAAVEEWFNTANMSKSPDETNGRQFRRIVRMLKKFAKSRDSWKSQTTSGFAITILAEEKYVANKDREDTALRDTMRAIYNRLCLNLEVDHPVTPGAKVTNGADDSKMKFFRSKLESALNDLDVLDKSDCTREQALKAWDKVFGTDFFIGRYDEKDEEKCSENALFMANLISSKSDPTPVRKDGGNRFA
jgi:hypothetical protein